MNSLESQQRQESLKRSWSEIRRLPNNMNSSSPRTPSSLSFMDHKPKTFPGFDDDDLVSTVIPPVTVVLEGRSICQRIYLHKHASYHSLARTLRQMFVDAGDINAGLESVQESDLDLTNAIPGYLIAYEDFENDLLLAGDLHWKYVVVLI
ncbi:hypothetical protein Tsubulata_005016 [Turnera subulata]|uniref:Auxin-responsive protein n=1 Tax=Turnera subulata TaxID=218843 RepID=A0A9Q0FD42_9ROSI|nr:hypothetical protein Tsubulata_005016 [Turnera subulata]